MTLPCTWRTKDIRLGSIFWTIDAKMRHFGFTDIYTLFPQQHGLCLYPFSISKSSGRSTRYYIGGMATLPLLDHLY